MRPLLRHGRTGRSGARARAIELLQTVGLEPAEEFIDRHPYELSGGQRQRVAIARALAVEPDVLVADEPTGDLDSETTAEIMDLLCRLNKENQQTFVLVTHSREVAERADRIVWMRDGMIMGET